MTLLRFSLIGLFAVSLAAQNVADPNSLLQAIQLDDIAEVRQLLDSGVDPDVADDDGTSALMLATLFADASTLELLLDYGADPNFTDPFGATALMWAVPDLEKVRVLIGHGADANARSDNLGRTPLLIAASYPGTIDVLRLLSSNGADVEAGALSLATGSSDASVVRFLVEHGIDPGENRGTRDYGRPNLPTIGYMMAAGLSVSPNALVGGSHWQDPSLIERWIKMGADVNASTGRYGKTPLMAAAASELAGPETVRLLLENGADPNAESSEGERALDWAIYRSAQARIDVLEEYGAMRGNGPRQRSFPPPERNARMDPRVSVGRSVDLLLKASPPMFDRSTCVTCHNNTLPAVAAALARRKGIEVDEELAAENLDDMLAVFPPSGERLMQGQQTIGGIALTVGYVAEALGAEKYPLNKVIAAMSHWVAATQMPDGSWIGNGANRPPIEYSTISHTAMAVRVLALYPIPSRSDETAERLAMAQRWLVSSEANSAEERGMRLMGLVWTGAPRSAVEAAIEEIRGHQGADGGWPQLSQLEPDAYGTGLSLVALHEAGVPVDDATYRRGIEFLLETQYRDGSWLVKSRSFPSQVYFESGFPFDRHQWISSAGTGWAAIAISHTLQ